MKINPKVLDCMEVLRRENTSYYDLQMIHQKGPTELVRGAYWSEAARLLLIERMKEAVKAEANSQPGLWA